MKNLLFKAAVCTGVAGLMLTGCQSEDLYNSNAPLEQYENAWEQTFGEIDPNQTWNTARQVTASVNTVEGDYDVQIYTANPVSGHAKLVAKKTFRQAGNVSFDIPQALDHVFVVAKSNGRLVANGYYEINGSAVDLNAATKAVTRAEACPVTFGEPYQVEDKYWDTSYINPNNPYDHNRPVSFTVSYLQDVNQAVTEGDTWKVGEWLDLVGKGAPFEEYKDNLAAWKDQLGTTVEYVTGEEGPVELSLNFGATNNRYAFGYFYYKEGEDPNKAVRYVLLDQYNPVNFIKMNGSALASDMILGNIEYIDKETLIQGSKIKLVYNDNGTPTYTFPKDLHIVFFVNKSNSQINSPDEMWNSIQQENGYSPFLSKDGIHTCAVTYRYGDQLIMGIEDGTDWDMNDLLFFVSGTFENEGDIDNIGPDPTPDPGEGGEEGGEGGEEEQPDPQPEAQSWIIACEDLGDTDDFDFNDIVLSISHVGGTTEATITPLAAGGTLEATIYNNGQAVGEIHKLLGVATNEFANTENGITKTAEPITISVAEDFSVTDNMGGFTIHIVGRDGKTSTTLSAPGRGEAPQMICVPGDWQWPMERTNISTAYPGFGEWGANYNTNNEWYKSPVSDEVIER